MDEPSAEPLRDLARHLHDWHLGGVAAFLFGMGQGTSVVASHMLLFAQPLVPIADLRQRLRLYADALEDEQSWQALISHLSALES